MKTLFLVLSILISSTSFAEAIHFQNAEAVLEQEKIRVKFCPGCEPDTVYVPAGKVKLNLELDPQTYYETGSIEVTNSFGVVTSSSIECQIRSYEGVCLNPSTTIRGYPLQDDRGFKLVFTIKLNGSTYRAIFRPSSLIQFNNVSVTLNKLIPRDQTSCRRYDCGPAYDTVPAGKAKLNLAIDETTLQGHGTIDFLPDQQAGEVQIPISCQKGSDIDLCTGSQNQLNVNAFTSTLCGFHLYFQFSRNGELYSATFTPAKR